MKSKRLISILGMIAIVFTIFGVMPVNAETTENVIITEDFEGDSPSFVGNQATLLPKDETTNPEPGPGSDSGSNCEGVESAGETAVDETKNHYIDLYLETASDFSGEFEYGSSAQEYVDKLPLHFTLTVDIYQEGDNTQPFMFEYFTDDEDGDGNADARGNITLQASDVAKDQWYTLTVKKVWGTEGAATFKATLENKNTGSITTPSVGRSTNISSITVFNRMMFRAKNTPGTTTHWLIDNVKVTENFDIEGPVTEVTVNTNYDGEKLEKDGIVWTVQDGVNGTVNNKGTSDKTDDEYIDAVVTPTAYLNEQGNVVATTKDKIKLKENVPYGVNIYSADNNAEGNPFAPANFTDSHDLEMKIRFDLYFYLMYYNGTHRFYLKFASDSMLEYNDKNNVGRPMEVDMGYNKWIVLKLSVRDKKWGTISINDREIITYEMPEAAGRVPLVQYALYKTDLVTNVEIDSIRVTPIDTESFYINSVNHNDTFKPGESVILTTNLGNAVSYYVNGMKVADDEGSGVTLLNLKTGVYDIVAQTSDAKTEPIRVFVKDSGEVVKDTTNYANSDREYILEYDYDEANDNNITVNDGYFTLDLTHNSNVINYKSSKGDNASYTGIQDGIGTGKYKIVVTSGYAEVYFNNQFVFSTYLPYTYTENPAQSFEHYGLGNVTKTESGVKKERYFIEWNGRAELADYNADFDRFYSAEFDKLDASDETIVIYDGEYQAKLIFDERGITAVTQPEDFDVEEELLMSDNIQQGYYRLTVAKGLAQLFRNNEYINSFKCPVVNHKKAVMRKVSNPDSTTFVSIKNTDDIYFHSEDFEGDGELDPLEYWSSEIEGIALDERMEDPFIQKLVTEDGNTYLKITDVNLGNFIESVTDMDANPIGDFNLNVSADNPSFKWRAKADGKGDIHFLGRYGQKAVFLSFSYSFANNQWTLAQYNRKKTSTDVYDGMDILTTNRGSLDTNWHNYELVMNEGDVLLLCDGQPVLSYSGLINAHGRLGFGVSKGASLSIDDIEYSGEGKVSAGFSYISSYNSDSKDFFYHPLYGGIVAANTRASSYVSTDKGKTWSLLEKGYTAMSLNTMSGGYMGVSYASSGWNIHRMFATYYPAKAYEYWGSGDRMINGNWGRDNLLIEPEWYDTADFRRSLIPSRIVQVQDGKYKGRIFMSRSTCISEEYGGTSLFFTDADIHYNPDDTSYYDGTTTKTSSSKLYNIEWTPTETEFFFENIGINGQESQVVDMPNDLIRYFVRTDLGFLYYADSFDGGATFGEFKPAPFISPMCSFDIMRDPDNLNHYYAFFQYDANTSDKDMNGGRPRTRTALAVSYDAMENWHYVMDVDELSDDWTTNYTPCNHGMKVIDGVVYMSYGVGTGYSKIFAADISRMKPLMRFSEVHDKVERYTNVPIEIADENCVIPKESGKGMFYGKTAEIAVTDGNYDGATVAEIFGGEFKDGKITFLGVTVDITSEANGNYNIKDVAKLFSKNLIETEDAYIISNSKLCRVNIYQLEAMGIEKSFEQDAKSDFLNSLNVASEYGLTSEIKRHIKANKQYFNVDVDLLDDAVLQKLTGLTFYDISDVENVIDGIQDSKSVGSVAISTVGNGFDGWTILSANDIVKTEKEKAVIDSIYGTAGVDMPEDSYNVEFKVKLEAAAKLQIMWGNAEHSVKFDVATEAGIAGLGVPQIMVSPDVWTAFDIAVTRNGGTRTVVINYTAEGNVTRSITFDLYDNAEKYGFWTEMETGKAYIKDVRIYKGISHPISVGTVCIDKEGVSVPVYAGKDNLAVNTYIQKPEAPQNEGNEQYIVTTFDARNPVKGMPLALHISGGEGNISENNYVGTVSILSSDEINDEWYTYKIISKQVYGAKDMKTMGVYRKKTGTDENYESVTFLDNNGGRISSGIGNIRFGYRVSDEKYAYSGATPADTVWEVANVKVIGNGAVVTGYLTKDEGCISAELDFTAPDITATPAIGVYSGGRMVGTDTETVANGEGNLMLEVPFDSTIQNSETKVFIWSALPGTPYAEIVTIQ